MARRVTGLVGSGGCDCFFHLALRPSARWRGGENGDHASQSLTTAFGLDTGAGVEIQHVDQRRVGDAAMVGDVSDGVAAWLETMGDLGVPLMTEPLTGGHRLH